MIPERDASYKLEIIHVIKENHLPG